MEDKQWGMQRLESLKKPKKIELYFSHKNSPKNYYKKQKFLKEFTGKENL